MRHLIAATAVAGFLASGLAHAQMKSAVPPGRPSSSPQVKTATPIPVAQAPLESARRISREEAIEMIKAKKAVFVDVRGKDSYDYSHIKGAINIPLGDILTRIKEIPPKTFIITYCACQAEHTAALAVLDLNSHGIKNTAALLGGWNGWNEERLPVEATPTPRK